MSLNTFPVFLDGVRATALYHPQFSASSLSANFCSLHRYRSRNSKVQLGISVNTLVDAFFCILDCTISSDLSCDVVLGRDWFTFVSHAFPNATITISETECLDECLDFSISPRVGVRLIEEGAFFPVLIFDERKLNLQSVVAEDDSMDCDANPYLIDPGVIGPGATFFYHSDIGPGATLSWSSSLMSSENPSINGISHDETCYTASIPTNVTDFLTFIESQASSRSVLLSIA